MSKRTKKILGILLFVAAVSIAVFAVWYTMNPPQVLPASTPTPAQTSVPSALPVPDVTPSPEATDPPQEVDGLPVGKLVVTPERKLYEDGDLTLSIPALSVVRTVHDGTDTEDLNNGVGLYDYAQLPGEGNRNVSIAGHRNGISHGQITDKAPFYYIDTLKEGDYIYLTDSAHVYRYLWESCTIVEADDWSPIFTTGYSCITLTSCHPIGISDHRIILRGLLDEIFPYEKDFDYVASS
jgi:LPXTG-site transpeptidase (sortase) family protein